MSCPGPLMFDIVRLLSIYHMQSITCLLSCACYHVLAITCLLSYACYHELRLAIICLRGSQCTRSEPGVEVVWKFRVGWCRSGSAAGLYPCLALVSSFHLPPFLFFLGSSVEPFGLPGAFPVLCLAIYNLLPISETFRW